MLYHNIFTYSEHSRRDRDAERTTRSDRESSRRASLNPILRDRSSRLSEFRLLLMLQRPEPEEAAELRTAGDEHPRIECDVIVRYFKLLPLLDLMIPSDAVYDRPRGKIIPAGSIGFLGIVFKEVPHLRTPPMILEEAIDERGISSVTKENFFLRIVVHFGSPAISDAGVSPLFFDWNFSLHFVQIAAFVPSVLVLTLNRRSGSDRPHREHRRQSSQKTEFAVGLRTSHARQLEYSP